MDICSRRPIRRLVAVPSKGKIKRQHRRVKEIVSGKDNHGRNTHPAFMVKVQKKDYEKFYVLKPEADFSPEHNKRVIENSIKKYEEKQRQVMAGFREGVGERSEMVASYLKSKAVQSSKPIDKYLGKKIMTKLHGAEIVDRLRMLSNPSFTVGDIAKVTRTNPTARVHAKK